MYNYNLYFWNLSGLADNLQPEFGTRSVTAAEHSASADCRNVETETR